MMNAARSNNREIPSTSNENQWIIEHPSTDNENGENGLEENGANDEEQNFYIDEDGENEAREMTHEQIAEYLKLSAARKTFIL